MAGIDERLPKTGPDTSARSAQLTCFPNRRWWKLPNPVRFPFFAASSLWSPISRVSAPTSLDMAFPPLYSNEFCAVTAVAQYSR